MKRLIAPLIATSLLASLVLVFPDGQAAAIGGPNLLTAAGAGLFPTGASFQGIEIAGGTFGLGVQTTGTGPAHGDPELQLNGSSPIRLSQWSTLPRWITTGNPKA